MLYIIIILEIVIEHLQMSTLYMLLYIAHEQIVHTHVSLSSSIIWYQPNGDDALRLGR